MGGTRKQTSEEAFMSMHSSLLVNCAEPQHLCHRRLWPPGSARASFSLIRVKQKLFIAPLKAKSSSHCSLGLQVCLLNSVYLNFTLN